MQAAPVRQTFANGNMAHKQHNRLQTTENRRKIADGLAIQQHHSALPNKKHRKPTAQQVADGEKLAQDCGWIANTASAVKFRRLPVR